MPNRKKTDLLLVVRGDHNDADWIVKVTPITEKELARFLPLIEAIKKFKPYTGMADPKAHSGKPTEHKHSSNWPKGEYGCREDLGEKTVEQLYGELAEEFDDEYVPHAEGWNIHTIHEIYTVR